MVVDAELYIYEPEEIIYILLNPYNKETCAVKESPGL